MRQERSISLVTLGALLVALAIGPACAAKNLEQSIRDSWQNRIDDTTVLLKDGEYRAAMRSVKKIIPEMIERLGPGDGSTALFGTVLTQKALAHAGLGEKQQALWYWHIVLSLYPQIADRDLSAFGSAGEFLKNNIERAAIDAPSGFTPPRVKKQIQPHYATGAQAFGVSGPLLVEVVITSNGQVISPRIVQPLPAPTLSFTALEALKRWQFEPATVDGHAVDVPFQLTVNYSP